MELHSESWGKPRITYSERKGVAGGCCTEARHLLLGDDAAVLRVHSGRSSEPGSLGCTIRSCEKGGLREIPCTTSHSPFLRKQVRMFT